MKTATKVWTIVFLVAFAASIVVGEDNGIVLSGIMLAITDLEGRLEAAGIL